MGLQLSHFQHDLQAYRLDSNNTSHYMGSAYNERGNVFKEGMKGVSPDVSGLRGHEGKRFGLT